MNKPVGELVKSSNGVLSFKINPAKSGLEADKDEFIVSWKLSLTPEDGSKFLYEHKVVNLDGTVDTATAEVTRVQ